MRACCWAFDGNDWKAFWRRSWEGVVLARDEICPNDEEDEGADEAPNELDEYETHEDCAETGADEEEDEEDVDGEGDAVVRERARRGRLVCEGEELSFILTIIRSSSCLS